MQLIRLAAGVINQTPLDWNRNCQNVMDAISMARECHVSVLCLPELCITGYGCEDAFHAPGVQRTASQVLLEIAESASDIIVSVGLPIMYAGGLFNCACLIVNQKIVGFVAKQHLAGDGIHYEPRWFKRWPERITAEVEVLDRTYPLGDLLFDVGGVRIGFEICEDAWVGSRPGSSLSERGADLILNPSASHFAFGKHKVRRRFVVEGSRAFHVSYVYANLVGNEAGRAIYDGDAMIASGGELVAIGKRFSYQSVNLTTADVDIDATRMARSRTGSFEPEVDGDETDVVHVNYRYPQLDPKPQTMQPEDWEAGEHIKFEEFTRSGALGLLDYLCKSDSRGFVVSASGGVDSTSVIVLCAFAIRLAELELGLEGLQSRLPVPGAEPMTGHRKIVELLLTTVYQSTRNSSKTTRDAARRVAEAVGATHLQLDVDQLVEDYTSMIGAVVGSRPTWSEHDVALQNIQARVRSPGIWMLANLKHALLLSTSNRSESAVGYATMDGDTSGGLAPIAGIDKAFLRRWLRWIETEGPQGIGCLQEVDCVNRQEPTAELRPASSGQTDEADLMPYDVLDVIERLAIRDKLMPLSVFKHLQIDFAAHTDEQLGQWTMRFFRLWCRNQWKRERLAPSFHYDDENLDPKTWCRFPILSGGYEREIDELARHLRSLDVRLTSD